MAVETAEREAHWPGWVGYLTTLFGAVAGFVPTYVAVGRGLYPLAIRAADDSWGPQVDAANATYYLAIFAGVVIVCLVTTAGAYAFSRVARSGAELETALLAAPGMLAAIYLVYQRQWWGAYVPLLVTALLLSRWLGVRWHAWRTRARTATPT